MTTSVGAYEAKSHLSELLDRVARGTSITITRRGKPLAMLVPFSQTQPPGSAKHTIAALRRFSRGKKLGRLSVQSLRRQGRR